MKDPLLEPDCYVKLADGEGGVRWVACKSLGVREREDLQGDRHIEVLVRPIGGLTTAWVHAGLAADADQFQDGEVEVDVA